MRIYETLAAETSPLGLATVVHTEGSSPGQPAMKMLVGPNGRLAGTIGGGHVEAAVEAAAKEAIQTGRPHKMSFTLDDDMAEEGGLICGGTVHILVERVEPPYDWAGQAAGCVRSGRRGVLLAHIGDRIERELLLGADAEPWLENDSPRLEKETFVEPLFRPRCVVLGAGHVGRSVAKLAAKVGFSVTTVDDRETQAARVEEGNVICAPLVPGFVGLDPGPDDYVVIVTRGTGLDLACACEALGSPARYVGMLGSRKKTAKVKEALEGRGVDAKRLHAPIGLDLGATSSEEIAFSIVAQMIKVRRTGRGDR